MDEREDRGRAPDANRQRQDRGRGEHPRDPELTQRVANLVEKSPHARLRRNQAAIGLPLR